MSDLSHIGVKKTFDMQTAFNDIFTGIAARGFTQAVNRDTGICTYADRHGYRCAVGMLIPDDEIERCLFEGAVKFSTTVQEVLNVRYNTEAIEFLHNMQKAHDYANSPNHMRRLMCSVAYEFGLDIPEVDDPKDGDVMWTSPFLQAINEKLYDYIPH